MNSLAFLFFSLFLIQPVKVSYSHNSNESEKSSQIPEIWSSVLPEDGEY